jgi:hypothetical protein
MTVARLKTPGPPPDAPPTAASDGGPGSSWSDRAHALHGPLRQHDEVVRAEARPTVQDGSPLLRKGRRLPSGVATTAGIQA